MFVYVRTFMRYITHLQLSLGLFGQVQPRVGGGMGTERSRAASALSHEQAPGEARAYAASTRGTGGSPHNQPDPAAH